MKVDRLAAPTFARRTYEAVGECIYCGAKDGLSDEHVIPFGLGGNLVLPKASCKACARVTSHIEMTVMRGPMRPVRVVRGIQSRRKHRNAPTTLPLRVSRGGEWSTVSLPYDAYPIVLELFVYSVPGVIDTKYTHGTRVRGHWTMLFGPHPDDVKKQLNAELISAPRKYDPSAFARMTLKVAYALAVGEAALDISRGRPPLVESILGRCDDSGRWIGTLDEPRQVGGGTPHHVSVHVDSANGILFARINFLADVGAPTYGVVLGKTSDRFVAQAFAENQRNARAATWRLTAVPT